MEAWILVLMIWGKDTVGSDAFASAISPHIFQNEKECKSFVAELRRQHERKRIDASCINKYTKDEPTQESENI